MAGFGTQNNGFGNLNVGAQGVATGFGNQEAAVITGLENQVTNPQFVAQQNQFLAQQNQFGVQVQQNQFGTQAQQMTPGYKYNIDNILQASFGEVSNKISAEFKKTILIRNYETETMTITADITLDKAVDGMDRTLISCLLQAQLELQCYTTLYMQSKVKKDEYDKRKHAIEYSVNVMAEQYERLTGRDAGDYLALVQNRV